MLPRKEHTPCSFRLPVSTMWRIREQSRSNYQKTDIQRSFSPNSVRAKKLTVKKVPLHSPTYVIEFDISASHPPNQGASSLHLSRSYARCVLAVGTEFVLGFPGSTQRPPASGGGARIEGAARTGCDLGTATPPSV